MRIAGIIVLLVFAKGFRLALLHAQTRDRRNEAAVERIVQGRREDAARLARIIAEAQRATAARAKVERANTPVQGRFDAGRARGE